MIAGNRFSHFQIVEKLGEGGMGVVYKARDLRLDRLVAIKVLPEKAVSDPEPNARFVQEAKAASALNHPNIVVVYEIDAVDGAMFIAMEYVDGRTLDHATPGKGLRVNVVLNYAVQIADGLAAAHAIGIIHRDLKPANIMVTGKGLVKLLDFGLAKLSQPAIRPDVSGATVTMNRTLSEAGSIVGTLAYMSPEQAEGKPVDARSDIFSFGIVLYEMLTGRRPFEKETRISTLAAIVNQDPVPARRIVEDLPLELDRIVSRCLRKDPGRRFQNMADLHVALNELKEESDSGALTVAVPAKPHRGRAALWPVLAALVLLGTAGAWILKRSLTPPPAQKLVTVTTYPGSEIYPRFSPDGNQVAFSWDGEKGGKFDIYVKLLGETNALRLTSDPGDNAFPAWSPDGKRIAFVRLVSGKSTGIYAVSPLGGTERKISGFPAQGQLAWTPDGKWLAASSTRPGTGIFLLPVAEGAEARPISHAVAPAHHIAAAVSPDGRLLAYSSCEGGLSVCDVYVQALDAMYAPRGEPRRISRHNAISGVSFSRDGKSLIYNANESGGRLSYLWRAPAYREDAPRRLEIAGTSVFSPSISPSGNRLIFSRNLTNSDIWRYEIGRAAEPLITSSLDDNNAQFSPDGKRIAFASSRSGEAMEIWVSGSDGSRAVQMTNLLGRHQGTPRWSPDGRWIAFDSEGQDGKWHVYVLDSGGGSPRRVTSEQVDAHVPSWSRDAKWIYFRSAETGRNEIWRVPFAGGRSEQVTRNGGFAAFESIDGQTLFYINSGEAPLFAKPLSGGPEREVLPFVSFRAFVPMEDGIYFIGRRTANGYPLEFFQFAGGTTRLLTNIAGEIDLGLSVSPDRKNILFSKIVGAGADLIMIENFQ